MLAPVSWARFQGHESCRPSTFSDPPGRVPEAAFRSASAAVRRAAARKRSRRGRKRRAQRRTHCSKRRRRRAGERLRPGSAAPAHSQTPRRAAPAMTSWGRGAHAFTNFCSVAQARSWRCDKNPRASCRRSACAATPSKRPLTVSGARSAHASSTVGARAAPDAGQFRRAKWRYPRLRFGRPHPDDTRSRRSPESLARPLAARPRRSRRPRASGASLSSAPPQPRAVDPARPRPAAGPAGRPCARQGEAGRATRAAREPCQAKAAMAAFAWHGSLAARVARPASPCLAHGRPAGPAAGLGLAGSTARGCGGAEESDAPEARGRRERRGRAARGRASDSGDRRDRVSSGWGRPNRNLGYLHFARRNWPASGAALAPTVLDAWALRAPETVKGLLEGVAAHAERRQLARGFLSQRQLRAWATEQKLVKACAPRPHDVIAGAARLGV